MGCTVLIKKHDGDGADEGMLWMRGDPVIVRADDHVWGTEEDPDTSDKFMLITVTDVTVAQATKWLERYGMEGQGGDEHITRLRLYRLIWDDLPQDVRDQLLDTGRYTTTWVEIKQFLKNMQSGEYDL